MCVSVNHCNVLILKEMTLLAESGSHISRGWFSASEEVLMYQPGQLTDSNLDSDIPLMVPWNRKRSMFFSLLKVFKCASENSYQKHSDPGYWLVYLICLCHFCGGFLFTSRFKTAFPSFGEQVMCRLLFLMDRMTSCPLLVRSAVT